MSGQQPVLAVRVEEEVGAREESVGEATDNPLHRLTREWLVRGHVVQLKQLQGLQIGSSAHHQSSALALSPAPPQHLALSPSPST